MLSKQGLVENIPRNYCLSTTLRHKITVQFSAVIDLDGMFVFMTCILQTRYFCCP